MSILKDVAKFLKNDNRPLVPAYYDMVIEVRNMAMNHAMTKDQVVKVCATLIRIYDEQMQPPKDNVA